MSKSQFVNGSYLTPNFVNSIFYTGGGHEHSGQNDDGCASKITLTNGENIEGYMPWNMMARDTTNVSQGNQGLYADWSSTYNIANVTVYGTNCQLTDATLLRGKYYVVGENCHLEGALKLTVDQTGAGVDATLQYVYMAGLPDVTMPAAHYVNSNDSVIFPMTTNQYGSVATSPCVGMWVTYNRLDISRQYTSYQTGPIPFQVDGVNGKGTTKISFSIDYQVRQ